MPRTRESSWKEWLTEDRLARWNALRGRADQEPISQELAARILAKLPKETQNEIIDRIE